MQLAIDEWRGAKRKGKKRSELKRQISVQEEKVTKEKNTKKGEVKSCAPPCVSYSPLAKKPSSNTEVPKCLSNTHYIIPYTYIFTQPLHSGRI